MKKFEERINLNTSLDVLSKEICKSYGFGDFSSSKLIKIGYEDYNFILTTIDNEKYLVKIFSTLRSDEDAINLANRACVGYENGVSCPKIYKINGNTLLKLTIDDVIYRIMVMEYIDGKDFYSLGHLPNKKELALIGQELAKLNSIEYKPPFIYDRWAIVNFEKEYKELRDIVEDEYKPIIDEAYRHFSSCDLTKLQYGFVHGDIIETNVMKSKDNIYFIDFSVSNYLPRIVDLAVTICDLCLDIDNVELSKERTRIFLNSYESISPLTTYEKECLYYFIEAHQSITILETTREQLWENNDSEENKIFLYKGKKGLKIVLSEKLF